MSNKNKTGNLYIIQVREFINKNESVYKIGRTSNVSQRFCQYPKGSILHLAIYSVNCVKDETELCKLFCRNFTARPDIGREYFEGDLKQMITLMTTYVVERSDDVVSDISSDNSLEGNKRIDSTIAMMEYVDTYRTELSDKVIKSKDLYKKLIDWVESMKYDCFISHTKMSRDLIKAYGVKNKPHRFDDGVDQALIFPNLLTQVEQVEQEYLEENNPVSKWLNDTFTFTNRHEDRITCKDLYHNYSTSYPKQTPLTERKFGGYMGLLGFKSKVYHGVRYYDGLKKNVIDLFTEQDH